LTNAALTFGPTNWDQPQTAFVQAVQDGAGEPDLATMESSILLVANSSDPGYSTMEERSVALTVSDEVGVEIEAVSSGSMSLADRSAIVTNLTEGAPTSAESPPGSSSFTYRVRLTIQPTTGTVSVEPREQVDQVRLSSGGSTALLSISPSAPLVFTTANFNDWQEVVVTVLDDNVDEGTTISTVVSNVVTSSTDARYDGRAAAVVIVGITDDDTAAIQLIFSHA